MTILEIDFISREALRTSHWGVTSETDSGAAITGATADGGTATGGGVATDNAAPTGRDGHDAVGRDADGLYGAGRDAATRASDWWAMRRRFGGTAVAPSSDDDGAGNRRRRGGDGVGGIGDKSCGGCNDSLGCKNGTTKSVRQQKLKFIFPNWMQSC